MTRKVLGLNLFNVVHIQHNIQKNNLCLYCIMSVDPVLVNVAMLCNMQYLNTNQVYYFKQHTTHVLNKWNLSIPLTAVAGSCKTKYTSAILVYVTCTKTVTFTSGLLQISIHFKILYEHKPSVYI
jgi:hypothetical protein